MKDGHIVVASIVAGHDFDKLICQKAFRHLGVMHMWSEQKIAELLEKAKADDPTFDDYSFDLEQTIMELDEGMG